MERILYSLAMLNILMLGFFSRIFVDKGMHICLCRRAVQNRPGAGTSK
jgi:hypothetical protein